MQDAVIDLRSDTMTQPTPQMRHAMSVAKVGDDVYGEDPTVNRLQERAAEIFQREAALFVPTGTMANQIAIKIHSRPGQEVICEERAHIVTSELGMAAAFAGCLVRPLRADDGILGWKEIEPHMRAPMGKYGGTSLIVIENTANFAGGTVYPVQVSQEVCDKAHQRGVPVYLDGARIFNAAVALGVSVAQITSGFDSLMFSLSKGLGAPVGSVLVGDAAFIAEARQVRKMLGGGMRQAGILAAAGLIALEEGPAQLQGDHENASILSAGLADIACDEIRAAKAMTNIVLVEVRAPGCDAGSLVKQLAAVGVLANAIGANTVRFVTHRDVSRADCKRAVELIRQVFQACAAA